MRYVILANQIFLIKTWHQLSVLHLNTFVYFKMLIQTFNHISFRFFFLLLFQGETIMPAKDSQILLKILKTGKLT